MKRVVAVVGGGPAGCSFAMAAARAGMDVLLFERSRGRPLGEWLAPEGKTELQRAGLWQRLPLALASRCETVRVAWERPFPSEQSFITNPHGCAWTLDRAAFDAWLLAEAQAAGVTCAAGASVRQVRRAGRGWMLAVETAQETTEVLADLVVDATGRAGALTRCLGRRMVWRDPLCAVVCTTKAGAPDDGLAIEATSAGWWYSTRVPDGSMAAAFFTDPCLLPRGIRSDVECLHRLLDKAPMTRARLPGVQAREVVAVVTRAFDRVAGDGWLAIGDAALSRDPLSGEGIAAAFRSAAAAGEALPGWLCGDPEASSRYDANQARARDAYLGARHAAYATQRRFEGAPFWARRLNSTAGVHQ